MRGPFSAVANLRRAGRSRTAPGDRRRSSLSCLILPLLNRMKITAVETGARLRAAAARCVAVQEHAVKRSRYSRSRSRGSRRARSPSGSAPCRGRAPPCP
eukprot:45457-Prymnesium_polylepis.1